MKSSKRLRVAQPARRVVIVGAGLAGLSAAHSLTRAGYEVLVLERGGHLGGKLSSAVGYGDMPIEHGVHGWWKGYSNFHDLLRTLHGDDFRKKLFDGPYPSRFVVKSKDDAIFDMVRPPPQETEHRLSPFFAAILTMVGKGVLSRSDVLSLVPFVARAIAFDHAKDYDRLKTTTARGACDEVGVTDRARELVVDNFTLASAFSGPDRMSAAALFSSLNFYIFDSRASLAALWLKGHPAHLIHEPLRRDIEAHGGAVVQFARVLGLEKSGDRVTGVYVDRETSGPILAADFHVEPRALADDSKPWQTSAGALALARGLLAPLGQVWLGMDARTRPAHPIAWTGARTPPQSMTDARWLHVEWCDVEKTTLRIVHDAYVSLGWIDARDVPNETFIEIFGAHHKLHTPPDEIEKLRSKLDAEAHRLAMHVAGLTLPPSLPLSVGRVDGEARAHVGICTHMGGRLRYDRGARAFACDLHGSRFGNRGERRCGPAEAGLLSLRLVPSADGATYDVQVPAYPKLSADHVVVATDVDALRNLLHATPALHSADDVANLMRMRTSSVTVLRFVIGTPIDDHLVLFHGFELLDALFNVTKLQGVQLARYEGRPHQVIEVQLFRNQTVGLMSRDEIVRRVRAELTAAFRWTEEPEMLEPIHLAYNRNVYSGFDIESEAVRIGTVPSVAGLYFAGDWVQTDESAWYMERAVRTGRLAARAILREDGLRVEKVPLQPPVRTKWHLRTLAREGGERGVRAVSRAIMALLDRGVSRPPPPLE